MLSEAWELHYSRRVPPKGAKWPDHRLLDIVNERPFYFLRRIRLQSGAYLDKLEAAIQDSIHPPLALTVLDHISPLHRPRRIHHEHHVLPHLIYLVYLSR